ncbi:hypothetical protein LIER_27083 [Lithospermum erythrorhizon]|uniref:Uncharacterized protein n=1 Tax=Lithospermum erythrorhizon TaxID=34254 RepID=A0AAV3RDT5_LITER
MVILVTHKDLASTAPYVHIRTLDNKRSRPFSTKQFQLMIALLNYAGLMPAVPEKIQKFSMSRMVSVFHACSFPISRFPNI